MRRVLIGIALAIAAAVLACEAFWPERLAVNTPLAGQLFGAEPPPESELGARARALGFAARQEQLARVRDLRRRGAGVHHGQDAYERAQAAHGRLETCQGPRRAADP